MKRLLKYLKKVVAVFAVAVVSCTDYGGRIEELQRQIDELAEYCNTLNANAEGLGRLIEAVRHGDTLVEFGPISEDGAVVGFRAVFESAGEVVVYNQDTAVSIGEENGRYYWMAGGDWMKDANGNRIEISALSALPLFKVEDETLKVSTDGGTTWSALGNMDTSMITSVEEDAQKVVFTFAGGATVVVPKYQALGITLAGDDATISAGGSVEVGYTITGDSNATVNVICGDGWEATVTATGEATGTITVTAPNPVSQDKVIVICSDSQGRMVAVQMRLSIDTTPEEPGPGPGGDDPMLEVTPVTLAFGSEGGSESVTVVANVGYAVVSSASWVTAAKATDGRYTITAAANANTSERTAVVTFAGAGKSTTLTVTQAAATLLVPVRTAIQLSSSGGTVTVGLNTNTEYTVTTDAFWLRYMGTRALRTDQLTFSAEANTGNARTATATITAGNYSTGIVFTQDGVQRYINLSTYAMNFDSEGGSATLTVNANVGYTWSVSSSWLSFTASGGNQFTVTVPANTSTTPRSATVTFSGDDAASKTLTVYQEAYEPDPEPLQGLPTAVCHLMPCCRVNNAGTRFLVNGQWLASHNYGDISQVRDILKKVRQAGIRVVGIDFTNPSQWDDIGESALHDGDGGEFWRTFHPMLDNIALVCEQTDMEFFLFIGNTQVWGMEYWNNIAGKILQNWAQSPAYHRYGYGDDRPMLVMFVPGTNFANQLKSTPASRKNNLLQFHIGTCQINTPITPTTTDGWGYRNYSASSDGKVRFACPNGGVPPQDWYRVDAAEWQRRVSWALGATEYAVLGSYDDTCDAIFWGIADVSGSVSSYHRNLSTVNDPFVYYNIVRKSLTGLD